MNNILKAALKNNSELIDNRINEIYSAYNDPDTLEVRKAELYSITAGGKRIRGFLVNEFCRACGGDASASIDFAIFKHTNNLFKTSHSFFKTKRFCFHNCFFSSCSLI